MRHFPDFVQLCDIEDILRWCTVRDAEMAVTGGRSTEEKVLDEGICHRFAELAELGEVLQ